MAGVRLAGVRIEAMESAPEPERGLGDSSLRLPSLLRIWTSSGNGGMAPGWLILSTTWRRNGWVCIVHAVGAIDGYQ